jgi:hypothetical protein
VYADNAANAVGIAQLGADKAASALEVLEQNATTLIERRKSNLARVKSLRKTLKLFAEMEVLALERAERLREEVKKQKEAQVSRGQLCMGEGGNFCRAEMCACDLFCHWL